MDKGKMQMWRGCYKRQLERKLEPGHSRSGGVIGFYSKCKGALLGVLSKRMNMIQFMTLKDHLCALKKVKVQTRRPAGGGLLLVACIRVVAVEG